MSAEEVKILKVEVKVKQTLIKNGYHRVLEKVKETRQIYSSAVLKGNRSGSGRIVFKYYDLFKEIYGDLVLAKSLSLAIDSTRVTVI